jgi:hypothetical protein
MEFHWLRGLTAAARVIAGFMLACLAAGLVTMLHIFRPGEILADPTGALVIALVTATQSAIFGFAFALIIAGVGEWLPVRSISYYLLSGIAIGLLGFMAQYWSEVAGQVTVLNNFAVKTFVTTGFFAGFVYWLVAGQFAGRPDGVDEAAETEAASKAEGTSAGKPLPKIIVEQPQQPAKKKALSDRLSDVKPDVAPAAPNDKPDANSEPAKPESSSSTSVPTTKPRTPHSKDKRQNDSETT